jgi:E3 ubiquitin-protein ligase RNF144
VFCRYCLSHNLESNITEGKVVNIPCMMHGCSEEFEDEDVERFAEQALYVKYRKFRTAIDVDLDPNKRWCPKNGCDGFVTRRGRFRREARCVCG